ncbi:MAG: DNA-formamidopyrimidine glycosylase [Mycoplasmataceae bacterium]|nr:DNA-formamidopyrimidine glycosylase [Mycoplasmataceae bacterium]
MPELPEVQTVINTLMHSGLLCQPIVDVKVYKPKLLKNSNPVNFKAFLINERINNIQRKGKFLIFDLSHQKTLLVHLRMEGKLFYETIDSTIPTTHLRIEFFFKNKHVLRYYDSRIFGTFHIYTNQAHWQDQQLTKLGLDPLEDGFNGKYLATKVASSNRAIKTAILDQTNVAGIGNIYADEILFLSKIKPTRKASELSKQDFNNIAKFAKQILLKAIKYGGTTIATYKADANHSGQFQAKLLVHTKKGLPCKYCGTKIVKIKVNGRGTYYCPNCQR